MDNQLTFEYVDSWENEGVGKITFGGCASSVRIVQSGEIPDLTKHSKQSVLSLGAKAAR